MSSETILVTGASSGLGLAFVQHYASLSPRPNIIAIDNKPFPANTTIEQETLHFHQIDITSSQKTEELASTLASTPITLILHCAGIRGLVPEIVAREKQSSEVVAATETLEVMDHTTMMRTFEINTWGTFNVVKSFLPNLRLAAAQNSNPSSKPKVVILSSRMGSISANTAGGGYAYRASKAALNAVVKSFAIDVPDVQFLMLHPGRVQTGLVEWKEEGAIGVEESVRDCMRVLGKMEEEGWESGRLVDRFGMVIPW
jgi:NAD(P)-dependent dehydrogenase (short-subunit alcohol dehydrogenase family)